MAFHNRAAVTEQKIIRLRKEYIVAEYNPTRKIAFFDYDFDSDAELFRAVRLIRNLVLKIKASAPIADSTVFEVQFTDSELTIVADLTKAQWDAIHWSKPLVHF